MEIKKFIKKFFCKHHYIKTRDLNLNEDLELYCIKCCKRKKIKQ